jgi:hypothetical protein
MTPAPTEPHSTFRISRAEYAQRARELDRSFNVVEVGPSGVLLRLDYPGPGLADSFSAEQTPEFARRFELMFGRTATVRRVDWFTATAVFVLALLVVFLTATPAR